MKEKLKDLLFTSYYRLFLPFKCTYAFPKPQNTHQLIIVVKFSNILGSSKTNKRMQIVFVVASVLSFFPESFSREIIWIPHGRGMLFITAGPGLVYFCCQSNQVPLHSRHPVLALHVTVTLFLWSGRDWPATQFMAMENSIKGYELNYMSSY